VEFDAFYPDVIRSSDFYHSVFWVVWYRDFYSAFSDSVFVCDFVDTDVNSVTFVADVQSDFVFSFESLDSIGRVTVFVRAIFVAIDNFTDIDASAATINFYFSSGTFAIGLKHCDIDFFSVGAYIFDAAEYNAVGAVNDYFIASS
jgi:hypothetical protein